MNSMIQEDERHTLLHNREGREQEFGRRVFETISRLKATGRIVSVSVDRQPSFSPTAWTPEQLSWIEYADHPTEQDELHSIMLSSVREIDIEDAGPSLT